MVLDKNIDAFLEHINNSLLQNTFVKLSLGNYAGGESDLKNVYIKRVLLKNEEKLGFTYRYKKRDIVKNYTVSQSFDLIAKDLVENFRFAGLYTIENDFVFESNKGKYLLKQMPATHHALPSLSHDRAKKHLITPEGKEYLHELNITGKDGKVYSHAQDKFRQINHFIQIIDSLIKDIDLADWHRIVDMGSGKGYLSFALYDYFTNILKNDIQLTGVEFRKDLVMLCNKVAQKAGFAHLNFIEGTIEQYDSTGINMLIALHACDTATDDAIWKGISGGASLIVVAPCCHKQIRGEIEKNKTKNELDFLTKYGIFLERQAEMVTDGIRALILEYFGYTTKIFDFISDAHTPKNIMIVGIKNRNEKNRNKLLEKLKEIKNYFGIEYHHLEQLAGIDSLT